MTQSEGAGDTCLACGMVHFVDPKTGKTPGEKSGE
jgi:hypothetical protein